VFYGEFMSPPKMQIIRSSFETYNLDKQILMANKLFRSFSVSVSFAVKHFTKSDEINPL